MNPKDWTHIRVTEDTKARVNGLIGLASFWKKHGFEITPGSAGEVVKALLDVAGAP